MYDTVTSPFDNSVTGNVKFLSVPEASEDFDGILGLAPADESAGPLLVQQWFDQGNLSVD